MKIIYAFLLTLSIASVSLADHHGDGHGACKADIEKFCKDVKRGDGRIIKCLKEHKDQLSEECKTKGEDMKEKMKEAHEACKADVEKFCKDAKHGHGGIMKCLKEHKDELSQGCKDAAPHKI